MIVCSYGSVSLLLKCFVKRCGDVISESVGQTQLENLSLFEFVKQTHSLMMLSTVEAKRFVQVLAAMATTRWLETIILLTNEIVCFTRSCVTGSIGQERRSHVEDIVEACRNRSQQQELMQFNPGKQKYKLIHNEIVCISEYDLQIYMYNKIELTLQDSLW